MDTTRQTTIECFCISGRKTCLIASVSRSLDRSWKGEENHTFILTYTWFYTTKSQHVSARCKGKDQPRRCYTPCIRKHGRLSHQTEVIVLLNSFGSQHSLVFPPDLRLFLNDRPNRVEFWCLLPSVVIETTIIRETEAETTLENKTVSERT